nr:DUF983 domain-containing protein [Aquimarina algiphila]
MLKIIKGSKLYSILTGSCPVCQSESMYVDKNPYHLNDVFKMNKKCSHCQTRYKIEPSFFFGAMYVSYGLGVMLSVLVFLIAHFILGVSLFGSFLLIATTLFTLYPILARTGRNIWINLFLSFKTKYSKTHLNCNA